MTGDASLDLIDQLVADLTPVKPVPPLRQSVTAIFAAGAAVALTASLALGLRSGVWQDLMRDAGYRGVLLGLAVIAVAGCVAGLASAIPGRRTTFAIAAAVAVLGGTAAIGASTMLSPWDAAASTAAGDLECIGWAVLFSLLPIGVGLGLTWRTWAARPAVTAGLTLLGTTALGTAVVHCCCPLLDGRHLLLGHCSTPLLMAALGGVALGGWMRRWAR